MMDDIEVNRRKALLYLDRESGEVWLGDGVVGTDVDDVITLSHPDYDALVVADQVSRFGMEGKWVCQLPVLRYLLAHPGERVNPFDPDASWARP